MKYIGILILLLATAYQSYCQTSLTDTQSRKAIKLIYQADECDTLLTLAGQQKDAYKAKYEARKAYSDSTDIKFVKLTTDMYGMDSQLQECKSSNKFYKKQNRKLIGWVIGEGGMVLLLTFVLLK